MLTNNALLTPVLVLVAWSLMMWLWMYATRIPAIQKAKLRLDPNAPAGQQMATLPPEVRWKADNYNHLMEQPTLFYALAISLTVMGEGNNVNLYCAWAYVVLRIVHSLVQVLSNTIILRFAVFVLSTIPLIILTVRGLLAV